MAFRYCPHRRRLSAIFFMSLFVLLVWGDNRTAYANSDVYESLPEDVEVISYSLADVDGDSLDELGILYRSGGGLRLSLFHAFSGRWVRWWDFDDASGETGGSALHSFDFVDANGDGLHEVAVFLLSETGDLLVTRLLSFTGIPDKSPVPKLLLEDFIAPPGYPILGTDEGRPSVTFLNMGQGGDGLSGSTGYRRVYCWNRSQFEKCREVEWEIPGKESGKWKVESEK